MDELTRENAFAAFGMEVPEGDEYAELDIYDDGDAEDGAEPDVGAHLDADGDDHPALRSASRSEALHRGTPPREGNSDEEPDEPAKRRQSHEEREAHKAARVAGRDDLHSVITETVAATEARMRAEHERQLDEMVAAMGQSDPATGAAIRTRAELEAMRARQSQEAFAERLRSGEATAEDISGIVNNAVAQHPDVMAARDAAAALAERRSAQYREQIESEAAALGVYDSTITGMEAVRALDRFPQIAQLVGRGATLTQAYTAAYSDVVEQQRINAAVAAELQKRSGKGHLKSSRTTGRGGAPDVDQASIDAYKQFPMFQNLSNEEIRKHIRENGD